jgi:hypothetical protein
MLVLGYHTLENRDNVDVIEPSGPIRCTTKAAWLGHGFYFWDSDINWAHKFGRSRYYEDYMIFEAEIVVNQDTYDLFGNVAHIMEFREACQILKESGHVKNWDEIHVAHVLEYLKKLKRFHYNSIRAADNPDNQNIIYFGGKRNEFMYLNARVQICLVNKTNLSLSSFRVVYPEY